MGIHQVLACFVLKDRQLSDGYRVQDAVLNHKPNTRSPEDVNHGLPELKMLFMQNHQLEQPRTCNIAAPD